MWRQWLPRAAGIVAANLLGLSFAGLVVILHEMRPADGVIPVQAARFVESAAVEVPASIERGQPVRLPDDWVQRGVSGAHGWYRADLNLNVAPNRLWALYVPSLEMTPAVWVNDVMLGGDLAVEPLPRYWQRPVRYTIPNGILRPGRNTIDIRIAANGPWGRLSELYLGREDVIEAAFGARYFWRVTLVSSTAAIGLALSLFMLTTFLIRRDPVFGWFAAFAATLGVQNLFVLAVELPVANAIWDFMTYTLYGTLLVTGTLFTLRFLDVRRPRAERLLLIAFGAGLVLMVPWVWIDPVQLNTLGSFVWLSLVLLCALYPVGSLVRRTLVRADREVFALVGVYCAFIVLGVHDWLVTTGLGRRHSGHLIQFATGPALLTFGFILLRRFVSAMLETDLLNRELEARVVTKTRAFEESYELSQKLRGEKMLADERERIMREVHDGVGGQLIGTLARLDLNQPRDRSLASDLQSALQDLRLTIDSLESVEGDLTTALGLLRNRLQEQLDDAGIELQWDVGDLPPVEDLGPERVLHILRIAQEAITNAVRHSGCRRIRVSTHPSAEVDGVACAAIEIADDGQGFRDERPSGRGLKNMRYRAQQARLRLQVATDSGVAVLIGIPEEPNAQE